MSLSVGDVFRYAGTGPAHNLGLTHVHIVLKVDTLKGEIYCVPISREPKNWDPTCEVDVKDNIPGISQKSFAAYYHAKISALAGLELQLQHNQCTKIGAVSNSVLSRIIAGVSVSDECEPRFEEAINPKPVVVRRVLNGI